MLQLISRSGAVPSPNNYSALVRASLNARDFASAVEALVEMAQLGVHFAAGPADAISEEERMRALFVEKLFMRPRAAEQRHHEQEQQPETNDEVSSRSSSAVDGTAPRLKTSQVDEVYFLLVDLVRAGRPVPRIALDAIVEASGRLNFADRAFATFDEFEPLFGVKPDAHSFNALLASIAYSINTRMDTLVRILHFQRKVVVNLFLKVSTFLLL